MPFDRWWCRKNDKDIHVDAPYLFKKKKKKKLKFAWRDCKAVQKDKNFVQKIMKVATKFSTQNNFCCNSFQKYCINFKVIWNRVQLKTKIDGIKIIK